MQIRIGLIGAGWMGKAHVNALTNAALMHNSENGTPVFKTVADINEQFAKSACEKWGFNEWTTDWKSLMTDEEIDLIDITTPNAFHYEVVKEALLHGKHVYCEKPLTLTYEESKELAELAEEMNVVNYVGYNNLLNPAIAYIKELIVDKKIGNVVHFHGSYDQDGLLDPALPITWRHINKFSGSGALGDLGSHLLSVSQYVLGDMTEVNALSNTVIDQRPSAAGSNDYQAVENEDIVSMLAKYQNGAMGTISSSRIAPGRKNALAFEIQGTEGTIHYSLEAMNEVHVYFANDDEKDRGFRKVFLNPEHEGYSVFQPAAGIAIGYNDMKVLEANKVLAAITQNGAYTSNFAFASRVDATIKAILASTETQQWTKVTNEGRMKIEH